jgi:ornithine cyclodeaminase/alanine dehydrogenase-like protein (mu-crystallin family)
LTKRSSPRAIYLDARDLKSARNIQGAMKESGDVILSDAKIYADLGEALAGKVPTRANETTIFKSLGMAVQDIAAALLVYRSTKNNWERKESGSNSDTNS